MRPCSLSRKTTGPYSDAFFKTEKITTIGNIAEDCVFVSAFFGGEDTIPSAIPPQSHRCDQLYFTKHTNVLAIHNPNGWRVEVFPYYLEDSRLSLASSPFNREKFFKMMYWRLLPPTVKYGIWIDPAVTIISPAAASQFVSWLEQSPFIALKNYALSESYVAFVRLASKVLGDRHSGVAAMSTQRPWGAVSQILGANLISQGAKGLLDFWYEATNCLRNDEIALDVALQTPNVAFRAVNELNSTWKESLWHKSDF